MRVFCPLRFLLTHGKRVEDVGPVTQKHVENTCSGSAPETYGKRIGNLWDRTTHNDISEGPAELRGWQYVQTLKNAFQERCPKTLKNVENT